MRLMLYDPEFKAGAMKFATEDKLLNVIYPVGKLAELVLAMDTFKDVEELLINIHGGPGRLQLADGTYVSAGNLAYMAKKNPDLLAKNARILFQGCSVGAGASGDLFLDDVAKGFLIGKGGIIGAATVDTTDYVLGPIVIADRLPLWGDLKVYQYDDLGKRVATVVK